MPTRFRFFHKTLTTVKGPDAEGKSAKKPRLSPRLIFSAQHHWAKHAAKTTEERAAALFVAGPFRRMHDRRMTAARTPSKTPDLFWHGSARESSSPSADQTSSTLAVAKAVNKPTAPRHVLPKDLAAAVKQLEDRELDQLLSAVLAEQRERRRRVPIPHESSVKRRVEVAPIALTRGQINAVRAAFKAGVTPSRIARQFGLSQSDVRKVLASEEPKR
jgi:hypothetical protein